MNKLDFEKKGMIATKYVAEGCEFKKHDNNFKLVSTFNDKYEPFLGQSHSESIWDLISDSDFTSGAKHNEVYGLLLDHFKSGQTIFKSDANILLKNGEQVVYQSPNNITLKEPKSIRVTDSVHVGSGRRRGNHSFGVAASKSVGETKEVIKAIDFGQIIITNKRFIYSGNKRNIDVNISQITGITPYSNGLKLQRKNKQKSEYFTNIDGYAFNYAFNGDKYFFLMNGQLIKSMIEGGLNKTPKASKLQLLSKQKSLETKIETTAYSFDGFALETNDNWKMVDNIKDSHILTLERTDGNYKANVHITQSAVPSDEENFKDEIKNLIDKSGFSITEFKNMEVNGIDVLYVSSLNDKGTVELDVAYFNNENHQFGVFLTNIASNAVAKKDYENMIKSLRLKGESAIESRKFNFCPNCGTHVEEDGKFCVNCGYKLD